MKPTTTPAQLAANQANAKLSSGPKTPEGKARSSQNARKRFKGEDYTAFRVDDPQAINEIYEIFVESLHPFNRMEDLAIRRMATARHTIDRLYKVESGILSGSMVEMLDSSGILIHTKEEIGGDLELTRTLNRNWATAEGLHRCNRKSDTYPHLLRHQALADRLFRRAEESFFHLRSMREKLAADGEKLKVLMEANPDPQPEEITTTSPDPEPTQIEPESTLRTGTGDISGTVIDDVGPLADVTLALMDDNGEFRTTRTTAQGTYAFPNLPDSWYRLFIVNPADVSSIRSNKYIDQYEARAHKVNLAIGEQATHDFHHR